MKLITTFLILFAVSAFAATGISGDGVINTSANVKSVKLGTCNSGVYDTLKTGAANIYGPYNLSIDRTRPMFKGLQLRASLASFDAGDSIQFGYQVITGNKISDTISSGWTAVDTIVGAGGKAGTYTSISSIIGRSIVYRLLSLDASTAIVQTPIRVFMLEDMTASPDTKH